MIELDRERESSSSNGKNLLNKEQTWEPESNIFIKHLIEDYFQKSQTTRTHFNFCGMVISPFQKANGSVKPYSKQSSSISLLLFCVIIVGLGFTLASTNHL